MSVRPFVHIFVLFNQWTNPDQILELGCFYPRTLQIWIHPKISLCLVTSTIDTIISMLKGSSPAFAFLFFYSPYNFHGDACKNTWCRYSSLLVRVGIYLRILAWRSNCLRNSTRNLYKSYTNNFCMRTFECEECSRVDSRLSWTKRKTNISEQIEIYKEA